MKAIFALFTAALGMSQLTASPDQGFPWPPPWQNWQTRVLDPDGGPIQTTGVTSMKDGQIAVALTDGVAVLSADGKILRQAKISSGENLAIASTGDDLVLASSDTLLVVDGETLEKKASVPVGGRIYQIASNADGSRVAVARYGKTGILVNMPDLALKEIPLSGYSRGAAWLPDGKGVVFSTEASLEVFDGNGAPMQTLSHSRSGGQMISAKLMVSSDRKWLIAVDEGGEMQFWQTSSLANEPAVTYAKGGPWFSAFFAGSPTRPFAGRPIGKLSDAEIAILHPVPYPASEVTGIIGQPDGTVIFSTWRGDIVSWDLSKAPASSELARPITKAEANAEAIPLRFGGGQAYFSPVVNRVEGEGGQQIDLQFVWKGKVLANYAIPGTCASSSPLFAVTNGDGRFVVVSTGAPPAKALVTIEQLRETPALARTLDTMVEMQPSVYIVDGQTGGVSPVGETRGISAYYPSVNGVVAGFSVSAGSEWSGIATLDVQTKMLLRTGQTDLPSASTPKVFPMAADRVAVTDRDSHRIQWMTHNQKEIPKSEGPSFQTKLPFKPNGAWTTTGTTEVNYDIWVASPSPDGTYLAVVTDRETIDLLAWGEPTPTGCFPAYGSAHSLKKLSWQDSDTLVCEDGAGSVTYHVSSDLLRPVAFLKSGNFLGVTPNGKPCLVPDPPPSESLAENGYNHIVTQKDRRRVAWLPSISSDKWCEVPGRNLAAYFMGGLWVSDVATGNIIHGYNAPRAAGMAASKEKVFTRGGTGSVFEWALPQDK